MIRETEISRADDADDPNPRIAAHDRYQQTNIIIKRTSKSEQKNKVVVFRKRSAEKTTTAAERLNIRSNDDFRGKRLILLFTRLLTTFYS